MLKRLTLLPFVAFFASALYAGTVTISSPGSSSTSPVAVKASASDSTGVVAMKIYVDGVSKYSTSASSLSTSLSMGSGSHKLTVKAWNKSGASFYQTKTISVTSTSGDSTAPSGSSVASNIEAMTGWDSCTTCAGGGLSASYSMTQHQSSPSLNGNSTKFSLGGTVPFSHGLWWRRMSSDGSSTHFLVDMYYRIDYPNHSGGLEFAANQQLSYGWYKFSTQCSWNLKEWRVWDSANSRWVGTGVTCSVPPANTWQHIVFEYARQNGKAVFVAITVNGTKHYINKSFSPQAKSGSPSVGIHFQLNGNVNQDDYHVWVNKLSLTTW